MNSFHMISNRNLKIIYLLTLLFNIAIAGCPNSCSGHGRCGPTAQCTCFRGFYGADCSEKSCPAGIAWFGTTSTTDGVHSIEAECSNMGKCDRGSGECQCFGAFEGRACERMGCNKGCNGHGYCMSLREAAVNKDDINLFTSTTYTLWDADKIFGCICDKGYTGYDCSTTTCVKGHDYFSNFVTYVDEIQAFTCHQASGTQNFKLKFRGETSGLISSATTAAQLETILEAMTTIDDVTVTDENGATSGTVCRTSSIAYTFKVTFTRQHGDLPTLEIVQSTITNSIAYVSGSPSVTGTKLDEVCNNRGLCLDSGKCSCNTGFSSSNGKGVNAIGTTDDCGYSASAPSACAGTTSCNGHGTCSGSALYRCTCYEGFMGTDCSLRKCPKGVAWWDEPTATNTAHAYVECSNRGICDRTAGSCTCMDGFEGEACERVKCQKGGKAGADCGGAGECKSLRFAASTLKVNGVPAPSSYGETAGNANTWDADKIYGCICDTGIYEHDVYGFTGNTCELTACPYGDDPYTTYISGTYTGVAIVTVSGSGSGAQATVYTSEQAVLKIIITTQGSGYAKGNSIKITGSTIQRDEDLVFTLVTDDIDTANSNGLVSTVNALLPSTTGLAFGNANVAQADEVQTVTCTATAGTFTLTFRGRTTAAINYNAPADNTLVALTGTVGVTYGSASVSTTADHTSTLSANDIVNIYSTTQTARNYTVSSVASNSITLTELVGFTTESSMTIKKVVNSVKYELEQLTTVGTVGVAFGSSSAVACSNSGVAITITFRDNSGDLPLMTADKTNLAFSGGTTALTVAQTTAGTKEFLECSGRGSCDRAKGRCKCFDGMQSSNGAGKRGLRADCGKQQLI
jgi:hypothetical protein